VRLGQDVTIKVGAFKGKLGSIVRIDSDKTAMVLVYDIGRTVEGYTEDELDPI
jgi:transcription antitermination factor NusG